VKILTASALVALCIAAGLVGPARSQPTSSAEDVQKGRHLADIICANCHVVARDQQFDPILRPPAPSFESIAQRATVDSSFLQSFLKSTHRDLRNPGGMPNPELLDFQITQVSSYLLSLRNQSANQTVLPPETGSECRKEIVRFETALSQARGDHIALGTASESTAARMHRQPTLSSVERAENEAERNTETALVLARKLASDGKEAECLATLKKVALPLGAR
jgi:mono/diheme cytochrome c family protein